MTTEQRRFRIELGGRLSEAMMGEVTRRFGAPDVEVLDHRTVITTSPLDQSALRALLELLWDRASDVRSVFRHPEQADDDEATGT